MKKVYSKPEIMFEDFSVTANISSGCEYICYLNVGDCKYEDVIEGVGKVVVFQAVGMCEYIVSTNDDKLCYHVPESGANFTS